MEGKLERIVYAVDDMGYRSSYFINPSFEDAVLGITGDGNLVYSFQKMVEQLVKDDNMDETDAIEFIEFNTLRTVPYMPEPRPVVVYDLEY